MIISSDNIKIESNITTFKCPVIGDGTVLLLPSQVKKYLGSYIRHKVTKFGLIINKNTLLDIVSQEKIDNVMWSLVVYNNRYYYTPSEYLDTSKVITIEPTTNEVLKVERPNSKERTMKIANADSERTELYSDDYLVGLTTGDVEGYCYPDPSSGVSAKIGDNRPFAIQSVWKNKQYNKSYYGTQTFSDGAVYIPKESKIKILGTYGPRKPVYWSMIYKATKCYYPSGKEYAGLVKGDATWPIGQDWSSGKHINCKQTGNGIINYTYPANCAAPLADSADMFDSKYYGVLRIVEKTVGMDMHRKKNASNSSEKECCSNNISVASLSSSNDVWKMMLKSAASDVKSALNMCGIIWKNCHQLTPNSGEFIVTNYVQNSTMNFYICFKQGGASNGAISYYAIPDVGVRYISYTPGIPDYSDQIDTVTGNWIEDVATIDAENTTSDKTNYNDPSKWNKNTGDDLVAAYGVHIGPGDTSDYDVPGIIKGAGDVPPDYEGWPILTDAENYSLASELPFDTKHLTHINRFRLIPGSASGLSLKGFIFVTRPDLNLYHELDNSGTIDSWAMNPDLKRLPTFKYIARLRGTPESPGIGNKIMNSLEYFGTGNAIDTPWLTVMSNQAKGYTPIDRELDIVEMGETFHGNKIIYGEPTFKHKIAGTISIPFNERRDLTLYHTLKMWINYIQAVSMGFCKPRYTHRKNNELDYAVSLYYIATDETMENIVYWEKLTGLIPLTVPDSFFEWSEDSLQKSMEYSITFAYSFRSVMDEYHLSEINNLYIKRKGNNASENIKGMPLTPPYDTMSYNNDSKYNQLIARVAEFYDNEPNANLDTEAGFNAFINDQKSLYKYYYKATQVNNGSTTAWTNFLPNWNKDLQMHGIPYVKGPFIDHDPNAQKYILRWV